MRAMRQRREVGVFGVELLGGVDPNRLTILMYDLVKLVRDGKEVKLSKRAGNLVTINDVVDEVGSDALRFNRSSAPPRSLRRALAMSSLFRT